MKRTNDRIRAGCQRETRAVEGSKNRLLAAELEMLLNGQQGVLGFLDNCGSVVQLKREADAKVFVRQAIPPVEDIQWKQSHRDLLEASAHGLYHRLHPGGQMDEGDLLRNVTQWAFQVPPDPEVRIGPSQARLSLVNQGPSKSYVALRERLERQYGGFENPMGQTHVPDVDEQNGQREITKTVVRVLKKSEGNETIR